jgi:hypothetical protein
MDIRFVPAPPPIEIGASITKSAFADWNISTASTLTSIATVDYPSGTLREQSLGASYPELMLSRFLPRFRSDR